MAKAHILFFWSNDGRDCVFDSIGIDIEMRSKLYDESQR